MDSRSFRVLHGKLAQYKRWNDGPLAWEEYWAAHDVGSALDRHKDGSLGELAIIEQYLPADLPVLEAGCGLGQLVSALTAQGHAAEGVEFSRAVISRVREIAPELNIRYGDVYHLDSPDGTYGGYISLGVFEHNPGGPVHGLREARRVLHSRGYAFISVPYLNAPRRVRLRKLSGIAHEVDAPGLDFYQFYYTAEEFSTHLKTAGLRVVRTFPYGVYAGLTRDYRVGLWLREHRFFSWRIRSWFYGWCHRAPLWARKKWGHMLLFVCRPSEPC